METNYFYSYYLYLGAIDYLTEKLNIFIFNADCSNIWFKYLINIMKHLQAHKIIGMIITVPVFTPPVKIQAPVVTAALIRPFTSNCLIRG